MIPKAVAFDLGKVLLDFDYDRAVARIQARSQASYAEVKGLIDQSPLLFEYETNRLSTLQFFRSVQEPSGFRGDLSEFVELFSDIFTPIEPMVQLHASLRARGIPTFIFSNTNEIAIRHIRKRYPFFHNFEGYVLSWEHGAMKPDHRLYEVVESLAGRKGPDLLYIDDRPENIATAAERGWQAILHETPEKTRAAVQRRFP